jgi:lipopolysaccharide biosynthesis glycosyltransferase
MMASGMVDKVLRFMVIYLLKRRKKEQLKTLKKYLEQNQSQISLKRLSQNKLLEVCFTNLTWKRTYACYRYHLPTEYIKTKKIAAWKRNY